MVLAGAGCPSIPKSGMCETEERPDEHGTLQGEGKGHVQKWCPKIWAKWKAEGKLDENLQGMANLAQAEYGNRLAAGYPDWAADEVARQLVQPKPEWDGMDAETRRESEEMEKEYRKNPPVQVG